MTIRRGRSCIALAVTACPDRSPKLAGRAKAVIVIEVRHAAPVISPAYDDGATTEAQMLESQRARFAQLHDRHAGR